jgi:signal recognition particle receptor subunit beta
MALINYANKEINAKIVYYGPGLSGKTTNIQYVFHRLKPEHRGRLITLPTQTDRTLFFDFLPVEIPDVKGFTTRFHLYTVPGQVFYNATRKMVLKGVDGIVFVADSQREKLNDNVDSLKNLEENLNEYGKSISSMPFVFQFNKRDLTEINTPAELNKKLNRWGYTSYEAIATTGRGVMETLSAISRMVLRHLRESYESEKILKYGAAEGEETEREEVVDERTARMEARAAKRAGAAADFSRAEAARSAETADEEQGGGDAGRDHLGVMGEYEETAPGTIERFERDEGEISIEIDESVVGGGMPVPGAKAEAIDLVLGGEVERIGPSSFKIPLTFRINDIKKDIVISVSFQISDSNKDRDIF